MSNNFDKIFYINLDRRIDRYHKIENELKKYDLYDNSERFSAIDTPEQGILGCTMSHLEVIKIAKERNYKQILILEDDFYFTISKEEFENELNLFFNSNISYHVCMISYNIKKTRETEYPFLQKILDAQTASGYILHNSFYDILIELFEEAVEKLSETKEHWIYANDQIWKRIQPISNWYALTKRCGKQRDGYSDNCKSFQEYDC
jgi:glycosyl transferase family 25